MTYLRFHKNAYLGVFQTGDRPTAYRNILQVWQSRALSDCTAIAVLGDGLTADQLIWLYLKMVPRRFPMRFHLHNGGQLL